MERPYFRLPPPNATTVRPASYVADMVRFVGPLRWFQRRLWRLKWVEATLFFVVLAVCMMGGLGDQPPLPAGQGIAMLLLSPLFGLYFFLLFKFIAFVGRCIPAVSTAVRLLLYWNDRFLSSMCEEQIVWHEGY